MIKRSLKLIADRQYGYFTAQQAKKAGYAPTHNKDYIKSGRWIGVDRGLFRLRGYEDTLESDFVKWSFWCTGRSPERQAVVSHDSAFFYYGFSEIRPADVHLSVPPKLFRKEEKSGCVFHRQELNGNEVIPHAGYNITTPWRTLTDMKPVLILEARWLDTVRIAFSKELIDIKIADELLGETLGSQVYSPAQAWTRPTAAGNPLAEGNKFVEAKTTNSDVIRGDASMDRIYTRTRMSRVGSREWSTPNRSFTMVELLVIVAVMTVLLACLMPALVSAREYVVAVSCSNNMRAVEVAGQSYAHDNKECFPPYILGAGTVNHWQYLLATTYMNEPDISSGLYNKNSQVLNSSLHCPADRIPNSDFYNPPKFVRCVAINGYSGPSNNFAPAGATLRRVTRIKSPSLLMFAGDGVGSVYTTEWGNGYLNAGTVRSRLLSSNPMYVRHTGGMNFVMSDGHTVWKPWIWVYDELDATFPKAPVYKNPFFDWNCIN